MAEVELPKGLAGAESLPQTRKELVNCFWNGEGQILPRPGIPKIGSDFVSLARGCFTWNNFLYAVYGNDLVRFDDLTTGANTVIGTIDGSSVIRTAVGFNEIVLVAKSAAIYTLDKMDFLTNVTLNQNFQPTVDVAHIDGIFVYIPTNGDPAYFSDVGDAGTVQPLSFFDAEELPDLNNAVFNLANTLYIMGTDSVELFRNVGTTPNPFARIQGARHRFGFIGGLLEFTNGFLFLGREKDQDFGFYGIGPGTTVKISNAFVDEILTTYAPEELGDCVAGRFKWRGCDIATFTLARDSFGFYKGEWFKLNTLVDGFPRPWLGGFIAQLDGVYFTASQRQFGKLAKVNTDFGEDLAKSIDLGFRHADNKRFSCQSIELGISQGFNATAATVGLFMSRDNRVYGPGLFRSLGAFGEYDKRLVWNYSGGLGNYDGFMGIRIYTTGDVDFAADTLFVNNR